MEKLRSGRDVCCAFPNTHGFSETLYRIDSDKVDFFVFLFLYFFFTSLPPAEVAEVVKVAARTMSSSPGTGGSNPRKFSEKIALHNQKQAEETRAFEQLMTDLTVSRVNSLSAPCAASVPLLLLLLCLRVGVFCWTLGVCSPPAPGLCCCQTHFCGLKQVCCRAFSAPPAAAAMRLS